MSWTDHMEELRRRIIKSLLAIVVGMGVSFLFMDEIMAFLTSYVGTLYFMRPAEAFMIYFKIIFCAGAVVSSPLWFYQLWAFLLPAFTTHEKKVLAAVVPVSLLLFLGGIAFSYGIVLPRGLAFLMNFTSDGIRPLFSMESYMDFVFFMTIPFGILFNLPLFLVLLAETGLVTSAKLRRIRKYVVLVSFILAALITPTTDIFSQCLLAVPLLLLYEGSCFFIATALRK